MQVYKVGLYHRYRCVWNTCQTGNR